MQDAHGNGTEVPAEKLEDLGIELMALQPDGEHISMPELAVVAEMVGLKWNHWHGGPINMPNCVYTYRCSAA